MASAPDARRREKSTSAVLHQAYLAPFAAPDRSHFWYYDAFALAVRYRLPFFGANWLYALLGTTHSICAPLWTVSIEEQFYLGWPALMKTLTCRDMIIAGIVHLPAYDNKPIRSCVEWCSAGYAYYENSVRCETLTLGIWLALFVDLLPKLTSSTSFLPVG
jgi:peptidoglycan/LPS O-acetylase OafA/YrhL